MGKYKVLIGEDHSDAREILKEFVNLHAEFEVIGETDDGYSLLDTINQCRPDLVLVDINMPHMSGIDAIKDCKEVYPGLHFIFVTAYDDYAAEAFDINAIDYVVKPLQKRRVFAALEKAIPYLKIAPTSLTHNADHKLEVKFGREIYFISLKDILYIEKIERKLFIHTQYKVYETIDTLERFQEHLDNRFIISHRSYIINVKHLSHITVSGKTYLAYFTNYELPASISKQKFEVVKNYIKKIG